MPRPDPKWNAMAFDRRAAIDELATDLSVAWNGGPRVPPPGPAPAPQTPPGIRAAPPVLR
ncbi:hypothetical protein [Phaeovulum sp.]|uniref:hypothetical protein n=1 Tax=Phaeovulum sp. TaxID=2934796 RepID=UPI002731D786|nr:hypothetical protein [Phaeovulum sp.]MDP1669969.1 hypothetical protein [Phaeovulum sp.]MDZ4118681.1 hypothetical protein [Phaeovulum sp.]